MIARTRIAALALVAAMAWFSMPSAMADEKELGWSDSAELSYVVTSGNSESSTLGFKNVLKHTWERALFTFNAGGISIENTTFTRTATTSNPANPEDSNTNVDEDEDTMTTAENYYFNGRYDRNITDKFFWYGGAGWDRNRFAGIDNRYTVVGGVGNIWIDRADLKFKTDYGITYTDQEDVIEVEGVDDTFLGFRFSWDYLNEFGANTAYTNVLIVDENLDETSDWRANMTNSLVVSMSEQMALKVSLQWLYDNEPSFEEIAIANAAPTASTQTIPFELDELDTIFTVSLVVNF